MTIPSERTRAVNQMAEAVEGLMFAVDWEGETVTLPREKLDRLMRCLRHYPTRFDMERTAEKCPELWG